MTDTVTVAIVGSGNIGTDLLIKLQRDELLDVRWMIGVDPASDCLWRAREAGVETSAEGVEWLLAQDELPNLLFEATAAGVHAANAARYAEAGITAIDLTPAAVGPFVIPSVNLDEHLDAENMNMVTCGGQAERGKAIIILNPADPPLLMRDTVYCAIAEDADEAAITDSIHEMVADVARFVPGYRLTAPPQFDAPREAWGGLGRVAILLEVEGRGDYFPPYAGNLDIMTAAAARVGHQLALARTAVAA